MEARTANPVQALTRVVVLGTDGVTGHLSLSDRDICLALSERRAKTVEVKHNSNIHFIELKSHSELAWHKPALYSALRFVQSVWTIGYRAATAS